MTAGQMTLPKCCLPGCREIVAKWGEACATCIAECGVFLQRACPESETTPEQLAEVFAERDRGTRAAYAAQTVISRS